MKKTSIYFLIFLIPFLCKSQEIKKEKYKVNLNNNVKIIDLYNISNKQYISINQLSYLFKNKTSKNSSNSIDLGFGRFTFLPSSYFAKVEFNGQTRIQQYNLLVLNYQNEILIPLHSFIYSLDSLNLYNTKIEDNQIFIKSYNKVVNVRQNVPTAPSGYKIPKSIERPIIQDLLKNQ
ncbi:MAG: hypothetical protein ABFD61_03780 [Chloroherpetonaceae bacterium]